MAADNVRHIEVCISRLNPATTAEDVENLAEASVALDDVVKYKAQQLKTWYDTYASYHLTVLVKSSIFDSTLSKIYDEDTWPTGVVIRRFFNNHHGSTR